MKYNKRVAYSASNRIGCFNITHEMEQDRVLLAALFSLCTLLHQEPHPSGRGTTYVCASELFEPLIRGGDEIPEYRIQWERNGPFADSEHQARRKDSDEFGFVAIRKLIIRVPPATLTHHLLQ